MLCAKRLKAKSASKLYLGTPRGPRRGGEKPVKRGPQGKLVVQGAAPEPFNSFVPRPLPPDPRIEFGPELLDLMEKATLALGRLDGLARLLPDLQLFLYFYVPKEAVLSSQIEGTQSSLSDLLLFESKEVPGVPLNDVQEVSS